MFRGYGILPAQLSRENPYILFSMLDSLDEEEEKEEYTDGYLRMFYGE